MTKFKSEFANAVKLFILLILLFWSFTWNSDANFDFSYPKPGKLKVSKYSRDVNYVRSDTSVFVNQHSVLIESFSKIRYGSRKASKTSISTTSISIPPFNDWKEIERLKYEKGFSKESNSHHRKISGQRKLNYASSKCGAKVLASNPEARYRIAVLNEKPDEYMLNPCGVKTWFVVELCDTVKATQIELANYELYSSSPKEFSVFWSEMYPTSMWHLLGTFEAKDQRTMQTFPLNLKNLGKFIKVILYSHHGKEHYCPLSVIRVLGYSMVENFENEEENKNSNPASVSDNQSGTQFDRNKTSEKKRILKEYAEQDSNGTSNEYSREVSVKICALYFMHCTYQSSRDVGKLCPNEPICRFLMKVLQKFSTSCDNIFCSRGEKLASEASSTTYVKKPKEIKNLTSHFFPLKVKSKHENDKKGTLSNHEDILKDYKFQNSLEQEISNSILNEVDKGDENSNVVKRNSNVTENFLTSNIFTKQVTNRTAHKEFKFPRIDEGQEKCTCEKEHLKGKLTLVNGEISSNQDFDQDLSGIEKDVDSAGLIQKESVLFKLTTRIQASEMDLSLINKYLQQLSQSYRQQMEDMQALFNQTVKAIHVASEKATVIDKKQQESINTLRQETTSLTLRVDYLMNGQRDLLKRVVEMNAFFLVLEFIIISTIFTIYLNIFGRKNPSVKYRMSNYNF